MLRRKDVMMGKVEKTEGMTGVEGRVGHEKWNKKRLGSHIRSTQDQCLGGGGGRRVWKHDETHTIV